MKALTRHPSAPIKIIQKRIKEVWRTVARPVFGYINTLTGQPWLQKACAPLKRWIGVHRTVWPRIKPRISKAMRSVTVGALLITMAIGPAVLREVEYAEGAYTATSTDADGNTHLASNAVNDTYFYDTSTDSDPATQQKLGIDPNWKNGVTRKSYALKFDGSNDYVSVPDSSSLNITSQLSLSVWLNLSTTAGYERCVYDKQNGGFTSGWGACINSDVNFYLWIADSVNGKHSALSYPITKGEWNHMVVTYDGVNTLKLYRNGNLVLNDTITTAGSIVPTSQAARIGGYNSYGGKIDDLRLYSRVLTEEEIGRLNNRFSISDQNLAARWNFDEGSGTIIKDSSQYANDGTLLNGATNTPAADGIISGPIWVTGSNAVMDGFRGCSPDIAACTPTNGQAGAGNVTLGSNSTSTSRKGYELQITQLSPLQYKWKETGGSWSVESFLPTSNTQLGTTGVYVRFNPNGSYARFDTFRIASWAVEAFSTASPQRGTRRSFPDKANLLANDGGVDIIDAETNKLWMRIPRTDGSDTTNLTSTLITAGNIPYSITAKNSRIYIGTRYNTMPSVREVRFDLDGAISIRDSLMLYDGNISERFIQMGYSTVGSSAGCTFAQTRDISVAVNGNKQYLAYAGKELTTGQETIRGICVVHDVTSLSYPGNITPRITKYSLGGDGTTMDGYESVVLTESGTIYAANTSQGGLDRWDNVFADTANQIGSTDRTYSTSSTPALRSNGINDISVTEDTSLAETGQNTVALATDLGTEVIEEHSTQASSQVRHYVKAGQKSNNEIWNGRNFGSSLDMDGSNDYVNIPSTGMLNSYPLTITAWFKTSSGSVSRGIVNKYLNASANGYNLMLDAGRVCGWYYSSAINYVSNGGGGFCTATTYNNNQWHLVTMTIDASGGTIYVDGISAATRAWVGTPAATTTNQALSIGQYSGAFLTSYIDDIRIYNRALSASEVAQLYGDTPSTAPTSGLVGYWPMNERSGQSVFDASGNGNNGTLGADSIAATDDPVRVIPAIASTSDKVTSVGLGTSNDFGKGLQFDNTNDLVSVPHQSNLNSSATGFSISTWFNAETITPNTAYGDTLVAKGDWTVTNSYSVVFYNTTDLRCNIGKTWAGGVTYNASNFEAGKWYHIACLADGSRHSLYVNGQLVASVIAGSDVVTNTSNLIIGSRGGTTSVFDGSIGDTRIYSRALTGSEVASLYNGGAGTNKNTLTGLAGWWKLNDASGQTAIDSSPNGNNGTLGATSAVASDDPTWTTGSPVRERPAMWVATNGAGANDGAITAISTATDQPIASYTTATNGLPDLDIVSLSTTKEGALALVGTEVGAWNPGTAGFPVDDTAPIAATVFHPVRIKGGTRIKGGARLK